MYIVVLIRLRLMVLMGASSFFRGLSGPLLMGAMLVLLR